MQIPWLFPIFIFFLTFNKIPWLFPDFYQVWNLPDFSLTAGHPGQAISRHSDDNVQVLCMDRTWRINTLRPGQNGRHFADDIFKCIFLNENVWIPTKISLKFVQLTIFQHWFRYWLGASQVTSHYLNQWWLVYWRKYASLGFNELSSGLGFNIKMPSYQ